MFPKLLSRFFPSETLTQKIERNLDALTETIISRRLALIELEGKIQIAEDQKDYLAELAITRRALEVERESSARGDNRSNLLGRDSLHHPSPLQN